MCRSHPKPVGSPQSRIFTLTALRSKLVQCRCPNFLPINFYGGTIFTAWCFCLCVSIHTFLLDCSNPESSVSYMYPVLPAVASNAPVPSSHSSILSGSLLASTNMFDVSKAASDASIITTSVYSPFYFSNLSSFSLQPLLSNSSFHSLSHSDVLSGYRSSASLGEGKTLSVSLLPSNSSDFLTESIDLRRLGLFIPVRGIVDTYDRLKNDSPAGRQKLQRLQFYKNVTSRWIEYEEAYTQSLTAITALSSSVSASGLTLEDRIALITRVFEIVQAQSSNETTV
eukprot:GHVQ01016164.1.p1 GENE.GHVQ01016164.1~~GHVQ01016164.1.p1  ORF type:complete len:283 (-),score=20.85 GHVQ01016164.1:414-1262(-)